MPTTLNSLAGGLNWSYIAKDPSTSQYYREGRAVYSKMAYMRHALG